MGVIGITAFFAAGVTLGYAAGTGQRAWLIATVVCALVSAASAFLAGADEAMSEAEQVSRDA